MVPSTFRISGAVAGLHPHPQHAAHLLRSALRKRRSQSPAPAGIRWQVAGKDEIVEVAGSLPARLVWLHFWSYLREIRIALRPGHNMITLWFVP